MSVTVSRRDRRLLGLALAGVSACALAPAAHAATFVFSSGDYMPGTTSPNPLGAGDLLRIVAGGNKFFNGGLFTNNGQVDWNDSFFMQNGAQITNNGLFNALGDHSIVYNGGSGPVFRNTGTFRKSGGAGTTSIGLIGFVNTGTIDAQTGTIAFNGGDATFNAGSSFIGAGTVAINSNAVFNGTFSSAGSLAFVNGRFAGNSAELTGTASFRGGRFAGSWEVDAGDTLIGAAGGNKYFDGLAMTNNGTIDWQTTNFLFFENGSIVTNNGLLQASADTTLSYNGGAGSTVANTASGTVRAASGVTLIFGTRLENAGTLRADGTIRYLASNAVFNNGTIFTGTGANRVESDSVFSGGYTSGNLKLIAGRYTGANAVANGDTAFMGGRMSGSWEIAAGQVITGTAGGNKFVDGVTLTNNGTLAWATTESLFFENSAQIVNQALIDVTETATFAYNGGSTTTVRNTAAGTIRAAAGKTLSIGTTLVSDAGTFTANGTIAYNNGDAVFNTGTVFDGAGVNSVNNNATFNGAFTSASNLVFANGRFNGGAAQVNGAATFTGGRFSGVWEVAAGQTLAGATGGNKILDNVVLTNNGTIAWNTTNNLFLENSAQLVNNALIAVNESTGFTYNGGSGPTIRNAATGVIRTAAGKTLTMGNAFVSDGGTITSNGTTLLSNGTATINAGSVFDGSGTTRVTNNAVFNGGFTSSNLVFAGGTFTGTAAVVGGTATFAGGIFTGDWSVGAGQTLVGADGGNKALNTGTFTNNGTIDWNSGNALLLQNAAVFVNAGTFDIGADMAVVYNGGAGPAFTNSGTIIKTGGTGTATIGNTLGFVNTGVIDVESGTLRLPDNFTNNGTLKGTGAFTVNGTLTNAGTVAPGDAVGTLTLNGSYAQTGAGIFATQLQATNLADLFLINGNAALSGTLALSCIGGCAIATGDVFTILDATGPLTGTFANVTTNGFLQGFAYDVVYDYAQNFVQLRVLDRGMSPPMPGVPEPASWAMMIAGFALAGSAARRRRSAPRVTA